MNEYQPIYFTSYGVYRAQWVCQSHWSSSGSLIPSLWKTESRASYTDTLVEVIFSGVESALARIVITNALWENRQFSLQIMFILYPFNSAIVRYFPSKFASMHLCDIHYQWLWPNCCKCNSFGDIDAVNWDNACRGSDGTSAWPRSLHSVCWPAHHAGLLFCNFFDMLTPVPYHHFFSSLILLFIYV